MIVANSLVVIPSHVAFIASVAVVPVRSWIHEHALDATKVGDESTKYGFGGGAVITTKLNKLFWQFNRDSS